MSEESSLGQSIVNSMFAEAGMDNPATNKPDDNDQNQEGDDQNNNNSEGEEGETEGAADNNEGDEGGSAEGDNELDDNGESEGEDDSVGDEGGDGDEGAVGDEADNEGLKSFLSIQDEYKTPEALWEAHQELIKKHEALKNAEPENPFANERMKVMNEHVARGGKIDGAYLTYISTDWSELDTSNPENALKIIEAKMRLDNPKYDNERVEYELDKLRFNEDELREALEARYEDEEEVNRRLENERNRIVKGLRYKADDYRDEIIKHQASLTESGPSAEEIEQKNKEVLNGFYQKVNELTKDNNTYKVDIDGEEVEVELGKELQKEIRQTVKNAGNPETAQKFYEERGGYAEALTKMVTQEKVIAAIAKKSKEIGFEEGKLFSIKKGKNHTPRTAKKAETEKGWSWTQAVAKAVEES